MNNNNNLIKYLLKQDYYNLKNIIDNYLIYENKTKVP